jgi:hypothetical protein
MLPPVPPPAPPVAEQIAPKLEVPPAPPFALLDPADPPAPTVTVSLDIEVIFVNNEQNPPPPPPAPPAPPPPPPPPTTQTTAETDPAVFVQVAVPAVVKTVTRANVPEPPPGGVAQVASPLQNVVELAEVPLFRFVTGRLPVTPVVRGKPVAFVNVPLDGVPNAGVTNVGLVANTIAPLPVLELTVIFGVEPPLEANGEEAVTEVTVPKSLLDIVIEL